VRYAGCLRPPQTNLADQAAVIKAADRVLAKAADVTACPLAGDTVSGTYKVDTKTRERCAGVALPRFQLKHD
jgi:hypothetical protein